MKVSTRALAGGYFLLLVCAAVCGVHISYLAVHLACAVLVFFDR